MLAVIFKKAILAIESPSVEERRGKVVHISLEMKMIETLCRRFESKLVAARGGAGWGALKGHARSFGRSARVGGRDLLL